MSETVFKKVDYDLGSLVRYIEFGEIGLPDIQRPFVWKNAKVRDLFDSMYRGYPVGYLLLWENGLPDDRAIGTDTKQKSPRLVIVDGQQRLTSLYAVVKGVPVVRENYQKEKITIAFNPLEGRFEVADAAIKRDRAFIADISEVWSAGKSIFRIAREYLDALRSTRDVTEEETKQIEEAITRLQSLLSFPFTALELAAGISEEDVADVFVRINSKGTPLNQADFILTLMSVFWDEGRKELEGFCNQARTPTKGTASPFNHFIEPSPDQLLRVDVGVAFKRARLKSVYSLLRGKDLETEVFSQDRRVEQFNMLKQAQAKTLNVQHWHDFLGCVRMAGFRSAKMISSNNNLLFSYMLYLIGKTEFGVDAFTLKRVIAQWLFMSAVTGRFTGSPESAMEFDLARLRGLTKADEFVGTLRRVCDVTLTNDFWGVTLPNDLATSSQRSPSLLAFNAAQVLLDARVLFSKNKISELLDPSIHPNRALVERHHLFPKGYLASLKITGIRETNQIANYAHVEWADNAEVLDDPPAEYVPRLKARFTQAEVARMYHCHALPDNWEHMEYQTFLARRRDLMAQVIAEGYRTLVESTPIEMADDRLDVGALIEAGESEDTEFKSTLRINLHTGDQDRRIETAVLKTLAGFLNTNGGSLVIGVSDDGTPIGIEADKFPDEDKMSLHLVNIVKERLGPQAMTVMHLHFEEYDGARVLVVRCPRSRVPVFVKDGDVERFYVRTGPATSELTASQTQVFIKQRFAH